MSMKRPEYLDWLKESQKNPGAVGDEIDEEDVGDAWAYYAKFDEYPPGDAPERTIRAFMADAKAAEKAMKEDLMKEKRYSEAQAEYAACQWPLRDDAPMAIVRNYIGCQYELQEAAKKGIDL